MLVQTLVPLLVGTKLSRYAGQSDGYIVVSPENYAKDAVDALGLFNIGSGCRVHELQVDGKYKRTVREANCRYVSCNSCPSG